jgi:hypothetical protein
VAWPVWTTPACFACCVWYSPVVALWSPMRPAKHLLAMRAIPRDPQRGRGALRRIRRHLRLSLGRWGGGGIAASRGIWG